MSDPNRGTKTSTFPCGLGLMKEAVEARMTYEWDGDQSLFLTSACDQKRGSSRLAGPPDYWLPDENLRTLPVDSGFDQVEERGTCSKGCVASRLESRERDGVGSISSSPKPCRHYHSRFLRCHDSVLGFVKHEMPRISRASCLARILVTLGRLVVTWRTCP